MPRSSAEKKSLKMKKLQDKKEELEKRIVQRKVDIQTAQIANKADNRKIREVEGAMFALDEFFDIPRSADDWNLYDIQGRTRAAGQLRKELVKQLSWWRQTKHDNKRAAFSEVCNGMEAIMNKFKRFGSSDTASREVAMIYAEKYAKRLGYDMSNIW